MSYIVHEIPYLDTRDLNLDWLIKHQMSLETELKKIQDIIDNLDVNVIVKPEDYGAVGDGIADDTEAIQKCIDENPMKTIVFKGGNYKISDTIYLYDEWGGQQVIFGGARVFWGGSLNSDKPMISITKETDHDPEYGSACRVLGGTFDALHRCGYCCEQYGFYTILDGCKFINFSTGGLFVGKIDGQYTPGKSSLQAKHNNLMIYHNEGNFSADDTTALIIAMPDCEYNQVITNRTRTGIELRSGGNSFINCHTTIQFPDPASITPAEYEATANIRLNPSSSGSTQENTFQGCYFNMGKYMLYSELASRFSTNFDSCYYIWYTSDDFVGLYDSADPDSYIQVVLCGGRASDFRCNNIDILVGARCNVLDYFPLSAPSIIPLPDLIRINSNDRHTEAPVYSAWNLQPENTLTPIVSSSNPATVGTVYEIGCVMLCYGGDLTSAAHTTPFKVRAYNNAGIGEWVIGFTGSPGALQPTILDYTCSVTFTNLALYINDAPTMVTIEGITYPTYYLYLVCNSSGGINQFVTMENDSPFIKTYVRAQVDDARVRVDLTPTNQLTPYKSQLIFNTGGSMPFITPITINQGEIKFGKIDISNITFPDSFKGHTVGLLPRIDGIDNNNDIYMISTPTYSYNVDLSGHITYGTVNIVILKNTAGSYTFSSYNQAFTFIRTD